MRHQNQLNLHPFAVIPKTQRYQLHFADLVPEDRQQNTTGVFLLLGVELLSSPSISLLVEGLVDWKILRKM